MTLAIVITVFVLCAIVIFLGALRSRRSHIVQRSVDLKAFRVLMDRDDENFLRQKLSRNAFFRLKRQRVRVTWGYVSRMSFNVKMVLQGAGRARLNADPRVVEQAATIVALAGQIRTQCLVAYAKMAMEYSFPSLQLTPARLESQYESLRDSVARLASLQSQNATPVAVAI
jgi:hypothetical protein